MVYALPEHFRAEAILRPVAPAPVVKRHMSVRRAYGHYWQEMLSEGQAQGAIAKSLDVEIIQMLLLGALNWSVQWYKPSLYQLEDVSTSGISLLFDGLFHADEAAANGEK